MLTLENFDHMEKKKEVENVNIYISFLPDTFHVDIEYVLNQMLHFFHLMLFQDSFRVFQKPRFYQLYNILPRDFTDHVQR